MANDSRNDDFPTIRLDEEDRRAYQQKVSKQPSGGSAGNSEKPTSTKGGAGGVWVVLVAIIALAACGGCYYLYDLSLKQQELLASADKRIAQLEKTLSATGEEIGESTVALQVKVTELSNRTEELWEQMDKLWASAWRRNQKEIADLGERVGNVQAGLQESINQVARTADGHKTQIAALSARIQTTADELFSLNVQLEQATADKDSQNQAVQNVRDQLAVLEQRNNALSSRIGKLENEIKAMATQMVSKPASTTPGV